MGKIIETTINRFDGGIDNDPRSTRANSARIVTNFDILTNPHKMTPYRDSEDGHSGASTQKPKNFEIALRTGSTYSLYALGVQTGAADAVIQYKNLTTGSATDLDDNGWDETGNNEQGTGSTTSFDLFTYYHKTGRIYGARDGSHIWAYDPAGSVSFANTENAVTHTSITNGVVHSKDDILYIAYYDTAAKTSAIMKNNNGAWTDVALAMPAHYFPTSICEFGNYLAIGLAPISGIGHSRVYLWDRDASLTTLSESIDWGQGSISVLEEVDGELIGISQSGGAATYAPLVGSATFADKVTFRRYTPSGAIKFLELKGGSSTLLPIAKRKVDNRLYFMMSVSINGATREGVWSIGRSDITQQFALIHERTPNNDTALSGGNLHQFILVGDFMFISYTTGGAVVVSKTNDSVSHTAKSIYETKIYNAGDSSLMKDLIGASVMTEFLPGAGQVVLQYATDENIAQASWTDIFTETENNSISQSNVNDLPKEYKEIQFRIESTGDAEITGLSFKEEITGKRTYD